MLNLTVDYIFIYKLLLTFIVGSIWITSSTIIAEKFGPKIGGVVGGMPSTVVISLFFIGWTQNPLIASQAAVLTPIVTGISALFILTYICLVRYNFYLSIIVSLAIWFILALTLVYIKFNNFLISLLGFIILFVISYYFLEHFLKVQSIASKKFTYTFQNLLFRGLLSGTILTIAVALAKFGGPILGGTFASFPAVFLSTMIITFLAQGEKFSVGIMKILMISGTINVTVYATAVKFLYPIFGLIIGTMFSFLFSLMSIYCVFLITKRVK